MTPQQAAALLAIAASFDNRKPDAEAATAWSYALDGYRFADCRDAIVQHYRSSSEWLMPAMIIATVRKIRDKRLADAPPMIPPPDLSPWQEIEWRRAEIQRIGDGLPPSAETRVLVARSEVVLPKLPPPPPAPTAKSAPADEAKRAEARAQIEAMTPAEPNLPPVEGSDESAAA